MREYRHKGRQHKGEQPDPVAGLENGMVLPLVIDHQEYAPEKQEHQHQIRGYQGKGDITAEQTYHIAAPKQRGVQNSFFELTHNHPHKADNRQTNPLSDLSDC